MTTRGRIQPMTTTMNAGQNITRPMGCLTNLPPLYVKLSQMYTRANMTIPGCGGASPYDFGHHRSFVPHTYCKRGPHLHVIAAPTLHRHQRQQAPSRTLPTNRIHRLTPMPPQSPVIPLAQKTHPPRQCLVRNRRSLRHPKPMRLTTPTLVATTRASNHRTLKHPPTSKTCDLTRPRPERAKKGKRKALYQQCRQRSRRGRTVWPNPQTAIPLSTSNSLTFHMHADQDCRNICMRHWTETQPEGQGLLNDFETYFKSLSDTDKEVCLLASRVPRCH